MANELMAKKEDNWFPSRLLDPTPRPGINRSISNVGQQDNKSNEMCVSDNEAEILLSASDMAPIGASPIRM